MSLVQSAQHVSKGFQSGLATLLTFSVVSAYCHFTEYGGTIGPAQCRLISRLRYPRLWVATLPCSVEVWGLHSLKETFWGQIAFPQDTYGGVVCPLFYLQIFTRTSIIIPYNSSTLFHSSYLHRSFQFSIRLFFLIRFLLMYIGTSQVVVKWLKGVRNQLRGDQPAQPVGSAGVYTHMVQHLTNNSRFPQHRNFTHKNIALLRLPWVPT